MVQQLERADRQVNVGDSVIFTDEDRVDHNALITAIHGESYWVERGSDGERVIQHPCVNLVFVAGDESRKDNYGRQTEHSSSVTHREAQTGGGLCWRFLDEPKPESQPVRS